MKRQRSVADSRPGILLTFHVSKHDAWQVVQDFWQFSDHYREGESPRQILHVSWDFGCLLMFQ
jgi:hypothetical protein